MSTAYTRNGHAAYDEDHDWQASLDYAADQERHPWPPADTRHPCGNASCDQLSEAIYHSEACRSAVEGTEDEQDAEGCLTERPEGQNATSSILEPSRGLPITHHEAPASANVFVTLKGRQVQLTLRDTCETRLLQRLSVVLDQFPLEPPAQACSAPPPTQTPVCQWHGAMKESTKVSGTWYCPAKMADGSYCKERHRG